MFSSTIVSTIKYHRLKYFQILSSQIFSSIIVQDIFKYHCLKYQVSSSHIFSSTIVSDTFNYQCQRYFQVSRSQVSCINVSNRYFYLQEEMNNLKKKRKPHIIEDQNMICTSPGLIFLNKNNNTFSLDVSEMFIPFTFKLMSLRDKRRRYWLSTYVKHI